MSKNLQTSRVTIIAASLFIAGLIGTQTNSVTFAATPESQSVSHSAVLHKTAKIDGLDIFYREAGPKDAPTVLLLHGFPTSSHMFRNLIPELADRYHVIAPDYPGYGNSSMPLVGAFDYTFDNMANIVDKLVQKIGVTKYSLYLMDYGAPVGFRLAV